MFIKRSQILFSFLLVSISFFSCEEEYIVDTGDFESSLVVNSMFTSGVAWNVSVTNSSNILDNVSSISNVEEAKVEIFNKSGKYLYDLFINEKGIFTNDNAIPSEGQCYSIKVSAQGYKTVFAQDQIPTPGELTVNEVEVIDDEGNLKSELIFHIGKSDKETYLVWDLYKESEIKEGGITEENRSLVNVWINQLYKDPKKLISKGKSNVIKTFDGSVTTTLEQLVNIDDPKKGVTTLVGNSLEGVINGVDDEDLSSIDGDDDGGEDNGTDGSGTIDEETYELRVMTISKELHDYYTSMENYFRFNPNSLVVPPSRLHSNVTNGYGIFASFHEQVIKF